MKRVLWLLLFLCSTAGFAAEPQKLQLTIDSIMRGRGLIGFEPRAIRWSPDGRFLYFEWKQAADPLEKDFDTWVVTRDGSGLRKLSEEEKKNAQPATGSSTIDGRLVAYLDGNDVVLYDAASGRRRVLASTTDKLSNPRIDAAGKNVTFVRNENLYLLSLADGSLLQLTNINHNSDTLGPDGWPEKKKTDAQKFESEEEKRLLDVVARRAKKAEDDKAKKRVENPRKPLQLATRQSVRDLFLAGDGKYVVGIIDEKPELGKNAMVPNFITESSYTEDLSTRSRAGDQQTSTKVVAIDTTDGTARWLDVPLPLTEKDKPRAFRIIATATSRDRMRPTLLAKSMDNKDQWVIAIEPSKGKGTILASMHDDAWVSGPISETLGVLSDGRVYYASEQTGWEHLYTVPWTGGTPTAITSGPWEIGEVSLTADEKWFFIGTAEASEFELQTYRVSVDGGPRVRVTREPGHHESVISRDGSMIAAVYSNTNVPAELFIQPTTPNATRVKITTSPIPEFFTYPWQDAPIIRFTARDGAKVPARLYKPANARTGGPAVIFVHGAGYLQNVKRGWSYYFREYMFHHLLMERGVTVLDIDYRASQGYGRDWRTGIYRHMGGKDLEDNVDGAKWLVREHGIDPERIGIYGGSYGGFITLMALFTQPDVFAAGAALRPVTDWAHYSHEYTSDILNVPQTDTEAYRRSSPIYFAEGLKGSLLICHGMADVNVHFSDSVRLAQRLIELRKEDWELAVYPAEDHSFVEPTSWADEYKRILKLFERTIM